MWIVRLALRRPYTFVVAALLVAILFLVSIFKLMATDIFPVVDIPVIAVSFQYTGMSPQDMERYIVTPYEKILTTTVNDIEHIESQSLYGIGVVKIYFQPNAKIENANAQVTAVSQTAIRQMPQGTQPPLIIEYNASNVPILQLSLSSDTLPEAKLFDIAVQQLRPQLIVLPGLQTPWPYGGKQRAVMVDLDPEQLYAYNVSPSDVSTAINAQNLILPAGTAKVGTQEYQVKLNASPEIVTHLNEMPIKSVHGAPVYIKDVAHVRDGFQVQTNVVHVNGKAGVLVSILKSGNASTLDVVDSVMKALPQIRKTLPPDLSIEPLFDQSLFVRASVEGVIKEGLIAAGLTALMILLFLGSWRSTIIVMISIPLSIMVSVIILGFLGQTLNVMTLGGMALAVGILVDDATVEIENIHRNLHMKKRLVQAILDGAQQIAVPAFVATLCICIVFVPVVFISGAAKYLFTPLAMAVVFAMMTSYLLSRTLVPTMVHYLLSAEVEMYGGVVDQNDPHAQHALHVKEAHERGGPISPEDETAGEKFRHFIARPLVMVALMLLAALIAGGVYVAGFTPMGGKSMPAIHGFIVTIQKWVVEHHILVIETLIALAAVVVACYIIGRLNLIWRMHHAFNRQFEKFRLFYGGILAWALEHSAVVIVGFLILAAVSCSLFFITGQDFFPSVDAGQIRLHVRAPAGTRLEQTQEYFAQVEKEIKTVIPANEIKTLLDNVGIPNSSINLMLSDGSMMSPADGEILVALNEDHHPTAAYLRELRKTLPTKFPELKFFFAPADIVTQVLNFGLQSPVDIQITGKATLAEDNFALAKKIAGEVALVPGVVDVRLQQVPNTPDLRVNVDRTLASLVGVTQRDVAGDLLISLSSSNQTAPNYWLNPISGVSYNILVQTPQYRMDSINQLENTPVVPTNASFPVPSMGNTQLLGNLAAVGRGVSPTNITHYNINPSFDVLCGVQGVDLAQAAKQIREVVDKHQGELKGGSLIHLRGQIQSMNSSFVGLASGLGFAVVLVYLLMVINFQSWLDPLIILMALPGALSGIFWMLWATQTNISVPALMGAIMSIGVATANSILMITFANDQREEGMNAHDAALAAGLTRLRPVLMTALAMIIGMLPMSLGLGDGGEQNAPLGRAVIGGLSFATFATLLFVPVVYSVLRKKARVTQVEEELR